MNAQDRVTTILSEYQENLLTTDLDSVTTLASKILDAARIFIVAAGRSRCVSEMFAMRLAQCGITTYMVGGVTTPAIKQGDLLICASGSGNTKSVITLVQRARETGVFIYLLTSNTESKLAEITDHIFKLPAKPSTSTQLLGNFTETCLLLILDLVIECIVEQASISSSDLSNTHTNIE